MKKTKLLICLISLLALAMATNAFAIQTNKVKVTFVAAKPATLAIAPNLVSLKSGETQVFTSDPKDQYGNSVIDGKNYPWGTITISYTAIPGTGAGTMAGNTLTATSAGTLVVRCDAQVSGITSYTLSAIAQVTVQVGPVSPTVSTVEVPANGIADGTLYTVIVTLMDAGGSKIAGKNVSVTSDRGTPPDSFSTLVQPTNAQGQAIFTIASTKSGQAKLTVVDVSDNITLISSPTITFLGGTATHLAIQAIPTLSAGTMYTVGITALDKNDNLADYNGTIDLADLTGSLSPTTVTLANGSVSVGIAMTTAITANTITAAKIGLTSAVSDPFKVDPAPPTVYSIIPGTDQEISCGDTLDFTFDFLDPFNNHVKPNSSYNSFTTGDLVLSNDSQGTFIKTGELTGQLTTTNNATENALVYGDMSVTLK